MGWCALGNFWVLIYSVAIKLLCWVVCFDLRFWWCCFGLAFVGCCWCGVVGLVSMSWCAVFDFLGFWGELRWFCWLAYRFWSLPGFGFGLV